MDNRDISTLPNSPTAASLTPPVYAGPSRKRPPVSAAEESRQKRKVTRACDLCKARKAKCSGTQPCETCAKRGLSCLYEARYLRGRPPTPELSGAARPSITMSTLLSFSSRQSAEPEQSTENEQQLGIPSCQSHELAQGLAVATTLQHPAIVEEVPSRGSPELEVAGQYSDSTSGLSFLHRCWQRVSSNQASHWKALNGALGFTEDHQLLMHAGDKPFQNQGNVQPPPLLEAHKLVDLYFDVCIATYRLLHRPTLNRWLEIALQDPAPSATRQEWGGLGQPKAAIVLSVLAIAMFHEQKAMGVASIDSPHSPGTNESSLQQCDELFSEASRLTAAETGFPKLESAQARLIQVLYLLMSSRMNQAWYIFGNALQIISALGLHRRERGKRFTQKRDYIEDQCRKRTFWVAYTLDKYLGVTFGRPRHYHDDDIDQEFPDSVNDEDMTPTGPRSEDTDDCHIESLIVHAK